MNDTLGGGSLPTNPQPAHLPLRSVRPTIQCQPEHSPDSNRYRPPALPLFIPPGTALKVYVRAPEVCSSWVIFLKEASGFLRRMDIEVAWLQGFHASETRLNV